MSKPGQRRTSPVTPAASHDHKSVSLPEQYEASSGSFSGLTCALGSLLGGLPLQLASCRRGDVGAIGAPDEDDPAATGCQRHDRLASASLFDSDILSTVLAARRRIPSLWTRRPRMEEAFPRRR
eukprot:scaffold8108_cov267-Pinguiococcus_pyrenoidosus.AAC.11